MTAAPKTCVLCLEDDLLAADAILFWEEGQTTNRPIYNIKINIY